MQLMTGAAEADPRGIDPLPALVQAPANPLVQQQAATAEVFVVREKSDVVVVQAAALQQAEAIADAAPLMLQHHHPHAAFGGQAAQGVLHPVPTPLPGKDPQPVGAFPAGLFDLAQPFQQRIDAVGLGRHADHPGVDFGAALVGPAQFVTQGAGGFLAVELDNLVLRHPARQRLFAV